MRWACPTRSRGGAKPMANLRSGLRRRAGSMRAHDALPPPLRAWLCAAALPWSPRSALKLWTRALAETGDPAEARAHLDRAEARTLARDAGRVWGQDHPAVPPAKENPRRGDRRG